MGRWEPDASGRLRAAALELYLERGFEQTTVADIAERAGVTARTFFRHFADKREVLFAGGAELQSAVVAALADVPASTGPLPAAVRALEAAADLLTDREYSRRRQAVIVAHDELRERELVKLAAWSAALAAGLRERGVAEPAATLAGETAVAVFRVAFERWVADGETAGLGELIRDSFAELTRLTPRAAAARAR
jgi:AcrR family transcriptional regulator